MRYINLVLFAIAVPATAQHLEGRFTLGRTTFADEGPIHHLTMGGSLRAYLSRRWSVEPEFLYMRHDGRDRDYLLWGNVAFDFLDRDRRVVPYGFFAPGLIHHRTSFGQARFSTAEAAFGGGFGARVFLSNRVFVAPQIRFGLADAVFAEVTGSIGFVLR